MEKRIAAIAIQTVLLSIILRSILETYLGPFLRGSSLASLWNYRPWQVPEAWLHFSQFCLFLILLGRFYWGAYRFSEEASEILPNDLRSTLVNFAGTFFLFSTFYVVSLTVRTRDVFYPAVLLMHLLDWIWFQFIMLRMDKIRSDLKLGGVASNFCIMDYITFAVFLVVVMLNIFNQLNWQHDYKSQSILFFALLLISILDIALLQNFYFKRGRWSNQAKALELYQRGMQALQPPPTATGAPVQPPT